MPKIKIKKGSVSLDMTAMCDVAFLLLTFFILTAKAKPIEPVIVDTPSSVVDRILPDVDILQILIDTKGRIFYGMDNKGGVKEIQIQELNKAKNLNLTNEEMVRYRNNGPIGVPFSQLKSYLSAPTGDRQKLDDNATGIPSDTANNELKDWILYGRAANSKAKITIKADGKTPYTSIKQVMKTLQDQDVNNYHLITNMEAMPKSLPQ